jgi:hypothetical protein
MESPFSPELQRDFIRPASITLRFANDAKDAYQEAVNLYKAISASPATDISEQTETTYYRFYQFRINKGGNKAQEIELRLELYNTDTTGFQSCPIIYWQIAPEAIDMITEKLESNGYQILDRDTITALGKEAERFIAKSPAGNLIAGHTNPPFPIL